MLAAVVSLVHGAKPIRQCCGTRADAVLAVAHVDVEGNEGQIIIAFAQNARAHVGLTSETRGQDISVSIRERLRQVYRYIHCDRSTI
jgi:hypothetical protein